MNKPKILFVSHSPDLAGAERCLLNILRHLDKKKFKPFVVVPGEGPLQKELDALDITTFISFSNWWIPPKRNHNQKYWYQITSNFFSQVNAILKVIEAENIDIVHTNTSVILTGAFAAKIAGIPHVWHLHEILDGHPALRPYYPLPIVYSIFNDLSHRIVVVSKIIEEELQKYISSEKIVFISNGIDLSNFGSVSDRNSKGIRDELGINKNGLLVGVVGNIVKEKGYDILIEAAKLLREKIPNLHFIIAGSESDRDVSNFLKDMILEYRLSNSFHLLGYREDIPLLLKSIDLYVNSSLTEAAPLSVIEAMAARKPVIATQCGGIADLVVNGETGYLVEPSDPKQLANAIAELLKNKKQADLFAKEGVKRARKFFDIRNNILTFEHHYKNLGQKKTKLDISCQDTSLRILSDVIDSIAKQMIIQQEQLQNLSNFVDNVKRSKTYRLYKWFQKLVQAKK